MKIAILGFGDQGYSAYRYWNTPENKITICDKKASLELPSDVSKQLGEDYLSNLDEFDLIVRSPSILPEDIANKNTAGILNKVTTVTNEFFKVCPTKNIIGVTGTKGKGTTSTLITEMLKASGKNVHLGGNIGTPPLDLLEGAGAFKRDSVQNIQPDDWVVLELANFQLIDLKYSPHIAVCLMVAPEHLDWHNDEQHYYASKKNLFKYQSSSDVTIYFSGNSLSEQISSGGNGQKIPFYKKPGATIENNNLVINDQVICSTEDFKLPGKHNWQNICAATTAFWYIDKNVEAIRSVVTSFDGLPYRLELVKEVRGVKYYNDSFGTTPETAKVAVEAFPEQKILILGGSDKGSDYSKLAEAVAKNKVKKVLLIGSTAEKIKNELQSAGYTDYINGGKTMDEIVKNAQEASGDGDIVLFSTASASFDMFKNYQDRGDQFSQAVKTLS